MFNQPFSYEKLTLETRQQELDRELEQIRRIRRAEECQEKKPGFGRIFQVIGWNTARFSGRVSPRRVECGCA